MDIDVEICPNCDMGYFKLIKDRLTGKLVYQCNYCGFYKEDI